MLMRSATLAYFAIFAHANEDGISCSGGQCTHEGEGDEVGLLSVRTASKFGPLPPSPAPPEPPQPQLCDPSLKPITTPELYRDAWQAQSEAPTNKNLPPCVTKELFGCFFGCADKALYGSAQTAWISPRENLMQYLYLQHLYGAKEPSKVTAGACIIVGFGPDYLLRPLEHQCLGVFTLPKSPAVAASQGLTPFVPTVEHWFSVMAKKGFTFDWSVQKGLARVYSQLGVGGTTNVLDVFHGLTNCSVEKMEATGMAPDEDTDCYTSVRDVYNALKDVAGQGTDGCVQVFDANKGNKWSKTDMGDVRTMLWRCFDANPWNTFVGLGWNSLPNPLVCVKPEKQTNDEHYTGAERVIKNIKLDDFPSTPIVIPMTDTTKGQNDRYTSKGFC